MISIIIPVYNQAEKLIKTISSLEAQSFQDFEVIIVNDGSQDGVEKRFADFAKANDLRHSYLFLNQENKGAPAARNRGFREAKGEYLFFCDADASLFPAALETLLGALNNDPGASYAYSSFYWGRKLFKVGEFSAERLQAGPFIHTMSLIRRQDFPETAWDESLKKFQDWDLWLSFLANGKRGVFVDQVLFRISTGGSISSWLPSFAYRLLPLLPSVKKYNKALAIVKNKYGLQ